MYKCSKCKLAVIYHEGKLIKACECKAPVILNIEAKLQGVGGIKQNGPVKH